MNVVIGPTSGIVWLACAMGSAVFRASLGARILTAVVGGLAAFSFVRQFFQEEQ